MSFFRFSLNLYSIVVRGTGFFGLLLCLTASSAVWSQGEQDSLPSDAVYKYKDDEGNTHIGQSIPPQFVKQGYVITDRYGQVLREVERALSKEEIKAMLDQETASERSVRLARERRQKDLLLLKTFSSAEDAERARDRKLAALDVIIDITKGNILRLEIEYENHQKQAAQYERMGNSVPPEIFVELEDLQGQMDEAFQFVKVKEDEKEAVRLDYEADIDRLNQLRGVTPKKIKKQDGG